VTRRVKRRSYDSPVRRAAAARTRAAVIDAAGRLFTERGYAETSVADIAAEAGVSVDTLYAAVGRKPQLLLAVHDSILSEGEGPLDAEQRRYVQDIRRAPTASEKIDLYVDALTRLLPRTAPLLEALRVAGRDDPACLEMYERVNDRRAHNMRLLVQELRATGQMRDGIDDESATLVVWSMNSSTYYELLRARGVSPEQYGALIRDVWGRTLLDEHSVASSEPVG
jgi:AcrR family transcriptional regulator